MKEGRPLASLAEELERQAYVKRDYLTPAGSLQLHSNGRSYLRIGEDYAINEVAHGQIAEYAGVPKPFYDRLRSATDQLTVPVYAGDEEPGYKEQPVFDVLVGKLLASKGDEPRLVRTLDGAARAFLSANYNVDLDNWDVFRIAASAIEMCGLGPENVASCEVTERRLYLKVLSPKLEAVVRPENILPGHGYLKEPQVVQAGFILTNSETGLGSLAVQQVVMKLMCTNLWIATDTIRRRHIGKALQADDDGTVFRDDTRAADARAKLLKIRDHVAEALEETRFRALVASMQETTGIRITGSVEKTVDATAQRFGLSQHEKEKVMQSLIEGADLSLWGLTNAITATAQTTSSYDRATELEAIGGRFFTMPASEIKQLANAGA